MDLQPINGFEVSGQHAEEYDLGVSTYLTPT